MASGKFMMVAVPHEGTREATWMVRRGQRCGRAGRLPLFARPDTASGFRGHQLLSLRMPPLLLGC